MCVAWYLTIIFSFLIFYFKFVFKINETDYLSFYRLNIWCVYVIVDQIL